MNKINENHEKPIELLKIMLKRKWFIFIFTFLITISSIVYVSFKNPIPIYTGSVMLEIGIGKNPTDLEYLKIDHTRNLKTIIERQYSTNIVIPKKTEGLLIVESKNVNKELLKENLNEILNFIIERNIIRAKMYENSFATKQIGDIVVNEKPINKPKKKIMVLLTFIMGLILSIFLVFGFESILKYKKENK